MQNTTFSDIYSCGFQLEHSPETFGELRRSSDIMNDPESLRIRMQEDGYLYLPGYLDRDLVLEARKYVTDRMKEGGMLDPDFPSLDAVGNKNLIKEKGKMGLKKPDGTPASADGISGNAALMELLYEGRMIEFYQSYLGGTVRHFDFTWMRMVRPHSTGSHPHCDIVYMGRGTQQLYTSWTPLGDIPFELGGLMMLEGSHFKREKIKRYLSLDVDVYCTNYPDAALIESGVKRNQRNGWLSSNPRTLREKLGGRWLTTDFRAGDVMIFPMFTVHCSMDNQSDRFRLSTDTRYQLASEPADERWVGENPIGHGVAGKRGKIC